MKSKVQTEEIRYLGRIKEITRRNRDKKPTSGKIDRNIIDIGIYRTRLRGHL